MYVKTISPMIENLIIFPESRPYRHIMTPSKADYRQLAARIKRWGEALGFQQIGICDIDLDEAELRLLDWLSAGFHGEMAYMSRHGVARSRPAELIPGTVRVISARMDYLPEGRIAC